MRRILVVCAVACAVTLVANPAQAVTLTGNNNTDIIFGGAQNDILRGAGGADILLGKNANDRLVGGPGGGVMVAGAGRDVIIGGVHNDTVADDDGLPGDRIATAGGNDIVLAADGAADNIDCGAGRDALFADEVDVRSGCEATITGSYNGFMLPFGGTSKNVRFGSRAANSITTGASDDIVFGLAGADTIRLGAGTTGDIALGGPGQDLLVGEAGADVLIDDDGTVGDTLLGGPDEDTLIAGDGSRGRIDCGAGDGATDVVIADPNDVITNCNGADNIILGTNRIR